MGHLIENEQILNKLISFLGYGNFKDCEIMLMGNEEGLGELSYEIGIKGRYELFGNDSRYFLNNESYVDGYFEPDANLAYQKLLDYNNKLNNEKVEKNQANSDFLRFMSRMILALKENDKGFYNKMENGEYHSKSIRDHVNNKLFTSNDLIKTALLDLRPIPRREEGEELFFPWLKTKTYEDVFKFKNQRKNSNVDKIYLRIRDERVRVIKKLLNEYPPKILISCGDKDSKKRFFEKNFTDKNGKPIEFKKIMLEKRNQIFYMAEVEFEKRKTTIILLNFFGSRGHFLKLSGLEELTEGFIRPIYYKDK